MSLSDKVIDELRSDTYAAGLVDKDEADELAEKLNRMTASADAPFGAQRMLALAVAAEVLAATVARFGMGYVQRIVDIPYIAVYGTLFAFFIGFFAAFAAYRLFQEYIARDRAEPIDSDIMSGFAEYNSRQNGFAIYFISAFGGVANIIVIALLLAY
jgi:hypothetical protein